MQDLFNAINSMVNVLVDLDYIPPDIKNVLEVIRDKVHYLYTTNESIIKDMASIIEQKEKYINKLENDSYRDKYKGYLLLCVNGAIHHKLSLIKALRRETNLGLKEAKDIIEKCQANTREWVGTLFLCHPEKVDDIITALNEEDEEAHFVGRMQYISTPSNFSFEEGRG